MTDAKMLYDGYYKLYENENHAFVSRKNVPFCSGNRKSDVVCVIAWIGQELVVIKQYRPTIGEWIWELPAGKIDRGETAIQAAERELKEETGLRIENVIWQRPLTFPSVGITDETTVIVCVHADGTLTNEYNDIGENIEVHKFDYTKLIEMFRKGEPMAGNLAFMIGSYLYG